MRKPRVVVADNHRIVAQGLSALLAPKCDVVAVAYDGLSLLDAVRTHRPRLVVQAMLLPPLFGMDTIRAVHEVDPTIKIIIVTIVDDAREVAEAFRAGASAFILKKCAASELLSAVHAVLTENMYVTPLIAGQMIHALVDGPKQHPSNELALRQRQILRLLAGGKSMKEAAAALCISTRTVAYHKYRLMKKLNIRSSAELVRFAVDKHFA